MRDVGETTATSKDSFTCGQTCSFVWSPLRRRTLFSHARGEGERMKTTQRDTAEAYRQRVPQGVQCQLSQKQPTLQQDNTVLAPASLRADDVLVPDRCSLKRVGTERSTMPSRRLRGCLRETRGGAVARCPGVSPTLV